MDRVDLVLALGVALVAAPLLRLAAGPVALVVLGGLVILRVGRMAMGRAGIGVALVALAFGAARGGRVVARHEAERQRAAALLGPPSRCSGTARVTSSPVATHGVLRWDATLSEVSCDGAVIPGSESFPVSLYGGPDDLARGDVLDVTVQVATVERFWNEATGDPRPSDARRGAVWSGSVVAAERLSRAWGPLAWIDRARAYSRWRIGATFSTDVAPMARALVLGESDLAAADDEDFRASGLAHLLAVSGMHLILVVAGALAGMRALLVRVPWIARAHDVGRWVAAAGLPLTWIYAELAGAGGSTLRAAWMMSATLFARALGRRSTVARAFGLSLVGMALVDPLIIFDLSFLLSAGATAGLAAFSSRFEARLAPGATPTTRVARVHTWLAGAAAPTFAATLPCAPILARFAPTQPLGGVVANLIAVPLGETVALPVCIAHALSAPLPRVERGAALVASGALRLVRGIAHGFAHFRPLLIPVPPPSAWQLALFTLLLLTTAVVQGARRRRLIACLVLSVVLIEVGMMRAGRPHGGLRATFMDVGQGDAALVDLPDGTAILIDGGGIVGSPVDTGERVVAPLLRTRRRRALRAVVLSHPHPDHFTGLVTGLASIRAGALWDTGQGEREGTGGRYAELLSMMRAEGVPILRPDALCGTHEMGGATVEVLAPCPDETPDRGPNDNSIVLRISYGRRSFLFVGDSERAAEGDLLRLGAERLHADVLKVGHHGSRTSSTPAFIAAVAPTYAVISTGVRNRFGHPHPATLATLARFHANILRTDQDGQVVAWTDGDQLKVESARGGL